MHRSRHPVALGISHPWLTFGIAQGISRRPKDKAAGVAPSGRGAAAKGAKPAIKKAAFDTTKKKEVGVSDLTLLSKVSNEAINENLKKRFENGEIYVSLSLGFAPYRSEYILTSKFIDIHRPCAGIGQSISRL